MLVCHCHAVNEQRVRDLIAAGARDELDIAAACGAGSHCGGCLPTISRLLGECLGCPFDAEAPDARPLGFQGQRDEAAEFVALSTRRGSP